MHLCVYLFVVRLCLVFSTPLIIRSLLYINNAELSHDVLVVGFFLCTLLKLKQYHQKQRRLSLSYVLEICSHHVSSLVFSLLFGLFYLARIFCNQSKYSFVSNYYSFTYSRQQNALQQRCLNSAWERFFWRKIYNLTSYWIVWCDTGKLLTSGAKHGSQSATRPPPLPLPQPSSASWRGVRQATRAQHQHGQGGEVSPTHCR